MKEILKEAGTSVGPHDQALVNDQPIERADNNEYLIPRDPRDLSALTIEVQRAVPVTLKLSSGGEQTLQTPAKGLEDCGKADLAIEIVSDGTVKSVKLSGDFLDTPTGDCIVAAVKATTFPPFRNPSVKITYPFILR